VARANVDYALTMLKERVVLCPSVRLAGTLDDSPPAAECLMMEIMLMRFVGPNMYPAPDTEPAGGLFDMMLATVAQREALQVSLDGWRNGGLNRPQLPIRCGSRMTLEWTGYPVHFDDEVWPPGGSKPQAHPTTIELTHKPRALQFLLPWAAQPGRESSSSTSARRVFERNSR
jgi:hypothetical protein